MAGGIEWIATDLTFFPPARDFACAKLAITGVYAQDKYKITRDKTPQRVFLFGKLGRTARTVCGFKPRLCSPQHMLNAITNEVSGITNLLAQGIRSPKALALALFSAIAKIAGSLAEIKNAGEETVAFFRIKNNEKNALFCFLPQHKYQLPVEAVTTKQITTKKETENLYKTAALYAAARILPEVPVQSYNRTANLFALYDRLEKAVDVNEPELYFAVNELRSALTKTLAAKQLSEELSIELNASMPLLALAHYLGSREEVLQHLNRIEDSFVVNKETHYV